ncbi:MAG: (d)CMP kinase [Lachnospiraceae bacterium]|nr:(d)CMP kinase [Lachnospiraceae bacterium]
MGTFSIALDGPAGAGKSTVAKMLAKKLGYIYVDTGAMYRAMALNFIRNGIAEDDFQAMEAACDTADVTITHQDGEQVVLLNGENVNALIRTEEVSHMTSVSSVNRKVRLKMVELQRSLAKQENVVMDGRDIGSYVLPDANVKVFLTASVEVRAKRRYDEQIAKGMSCSLSEIEENIRERDYRDSHREFAPLVQAEDAIYFDNSAMTIEENVEKLYELCRRAQK